MKSQPFSQHPYLRNSEWQKEKKVIVIIQRRAEETPGLTLNLSELLFALSPPRPTVLLVEQFWGNSSKCPGSQAQQVRMARMSRLTTPTARPGQGRATGSHMQVLCGHGSLPPSDAGLVSELTINFCLTSSRTDSQKTSEHPFREIPLAPHGGVSNTAPFPEGGKNHKLQLHVLSPDILFLGIHPLGNFWTSVW